MSRLRADLLLLIASIIWGAAFVAQKGAFQYVGACTFVAARFLISFVLVAPFAAREYRGLTTAQKSVVGKGELILLCLSFCAGVIFQQAGIGTTPVTNAGFLTGLYVIFVPAICAVIYKQKISIWIVPACLLSIAGVWFLSGGQIHGFSFGDLLVILCAICFALHVVLVGRVMEKIKAPLTLSCVQYAAVTLAALAGVYMFEAPTWHNIQNALWPILYAGAISGGIAYTFQIIAQQYAPASDSAIILSSEALFAAVAGALLLGERLTTMKYVGCGLIILAILLVELAPLVLKKKSVTAPE